jgi:putative methionine-R-sulfoxide reductase with GAF domain
VLDIDSPHGARFTRADQSGAEALCARFVGILEAQQMPFDEFI